MQCKNEIRITAQHCLEDRYIQLYVVLSFVVVDREYLLVQSESELKIIHPTGRQVGVIHILFCIIPSLIKR
jgi:hypothetical protein